MSHDLKNVENRAERDRIHKERAELDLEKFFELYKNKIEVISYNPLQMNKEYSEFFMMVRLSTPMKPRQFLKMIIDKIGDDL